MRERKGKIVATLGPASSTPDTVRALFDAGADVFRLNFSHGTRDDHRAAHAAVRGVEAAVGRPIGMLTDLQGPRLRIGVFAGGAVELAEGARFRLDLDPAPGDRGRAPLPHPEVFAAVAPGVELLLDDGRIRLRIDGVATDHAETTVTAGGRLSDRKGVNVPGAVLPMSALSDKDREDLEFALDLGVDWVGLSFVQRPEDVHAARDIIGGRAGIVAKIEKPAAIDRLHDIIEAADGIMVARGDLGVELPLEEVPGLQKRILRAARSAGRPVIVATQMLESMVRAPLPTRAEISDVASAVYDGADAVMLSAETGSRRLPDRIRRR